MQACGCHTAHHRQRIVLTGGPGAGKTAVLELVRQSMCQHVAVLPEAAGILFGGGFPRAPGPIERAAAQRAIYRVQRELEVIADVHDNAAIMLCDRGTVDGAAYWPGPDTLWSAVESTREQELARYDAVIHLRTAPPEAYNRDNPLRIESAHEASLIDERIAQAWADHPRRFFVDGTADFLVKADRAVALLRDLMPACCRSFMPPPAARATPSPRAFAPDGGTR
jgi:predicted ATPase